MLACPKTPNCVGTFVIADVAIVTEVGCLHVNRMSGIAMFIGCAPVCDVWCSCVMMSI